MLKGFKIRIYPTKEQENLIWKHFDGCRFVWNHLLAMQTENYKNGGKFIGNFDMCKRIVELKKQDDYAWLNEISNGSLLLVCRDLDETYKMFFNKAVPHPRFKKKKQNKLKYPVRSDRFYLGQRKSDIQAKFWQRNNSSSGK